MNELEALKQLTADEATLLSARQVLVEIMRNFGGPKGFADLITADMGALPCGAPARVQLGMNVLKALQSFGVDNEPDDADDEDLEAILKDLIQQQSDDGDS